MGEKLSWRDVRRQWGSSLLVLQERTEEVDEKQLEEHAVALSVRPLQHQRQGHTA